MKKRTVTTVVALLVVSISVLTGCTRTTARTERKTTEPETKEVIVKEEKKEETSEAKEITLKETDSSDVNPVEASLESPAEIGEWVATSVYSAVDGEYHTAYYRITGVIRGDEAKKIVDDYNAEGHVVTISDLEEEDLEYGVITYDSYFPTDFPEADYGITSTSMDFSICNTEDYGAIGDYIGLSSVWDISEEPETNEFYAGDTFTEGKAVFAMVKDYNDYLIKSDYFDENDEEIVTYTKGK